MNTEPDEAKLTAFALGELDASDRAAVEGRLADDPAARHTVEEVRELAEIAREELAAAPAGRLTDTQRSALEARASALGAERTARRRRRVLWLSVGIPAAAAAILIALGTAVWWEAIFPPASPRPISGVDPNGPRQGPSLVGTPGRRGGTPELVGTPEHRPETQPASRPSAPSATSAPAGQGT